MLKILSAEQQRELDKYTIEHEPVSSINIMERAAARCSDFLLNNSAAGNVFRYFVATEIMEATD